MEKFIESPLVIIYEPDKESFGFYYLRQDGSKRLRSYWELSKLKKIGLNRACFEIGESILASFKESREALF
jgi:hypothetical protein